MMIYLLEKRIGKQAKWKDRLQNKQKAFGCARRRPPLGFFFSEFPRFETMRGLDGPEGNCVWSDLFAIALLKAEAELSDRRVKQATARYRLSGASCRYIVGILQGVIVGEKSAWSDRSSDPFDFCQGIMAEIDQQAKW